MNDDSIFVYRIVCCKCCYNAGQIRIDITKAVHIEIGARLGQRPIAVVCVQMAAVCTQRIAVGTLCCSNFLVLGRIAYISLYIVGIIEGHVFQYGRLPLGVESGIGVNVKLPIGSILSAGAVCGGVPTVKCEIFLGEASASFYSYLCVGKNRQYHR